MNLEDVIKHCEEIAEENYGKATTYLSKREAYKHEEQKCVTCADEHMQLAEWLKDYKRLKERQPIDKAVMMYEIYMAGVNMSGEYNGCWVRFKDIEYIVNRYIKENDK